MQAFTERQGDYLAFIFYDTRLNGNAPAEADIQRFFGVSPPSVHNMVLELERRGLLERTPGAARSIRVLLDSHEIPPLPERAGPPNR